MSQWVVLTEESQGLFFVVDGVEDDFVDETLS